MTKRTSIAITEDRLRMWQRRLDGVPQCATPVCLVSVCHGEGDSGTLIVSVPNDLTDEFIAGVLVKAAELVVMRGGGKP